MPIDIGPGRWYANNWTLGGITHVDAVGVEMPTDSGKWRKVHHIPISCKCGPEMTVISATCDEHVITEVDISGLEAFIAEHLKKCPPL